MLRLTDLFLSLNTILHVYVVLWVQERDACLMVSALSPHLEQMDDRFCYTESSEVINK